MRQVCPAEELPGMQDSGAVQAGPSEMTVYEKLSARARLNLSNAREAILLKDLVNAQMYTSRAEEDYAIIRQLPVLALEVEATPWADQVPPVARTHEPEGIAETGI